MKELRDKQKIKRRLYSIPALVGLFVLTLLIIRGTYEVVKKQRESSRYVSNLKEKMIALSNREAELKTEIQKLGTDEGVESVIKEKFSVSKYGERVAIIVDRPSNSTTTAPKELNWLQKLWRGFVDMW